MAQRRYKKEEDSISDKILEIIYLISVFYVLYLAFLWFTDKLVFWRWFWYSVIFIVIIIGRLYAWSEFKKRERKRRFNALLVNLKQAGIDDYVKNFIARFGAQGKRRSDWTYRGHGFDWERLKDFRNVLNEKGMHLSVNNLNDVSSILRYYIQQNEENLTRESISMIPKKFMDISGCEFENLLYRLFSAMGYIVQKTGGAGDQGGDLIANLNGQRIVIQAKRYANALDNNAIQEAVAAKKFYDCNSSMVVTNSNFTQGAVELAKVNNVELINGEKLSKLLLQHLKESWG